MKSAWGNLVVGLADDNADLDALIDNLVESAETAAGNILPVVEKALGGIAELVEKLAPVIAERLPDFVHVILPPLIDAAISIVQGLIAALPQILAALFEALTGAFVQWVQTGSTETQILKEAIVAVTAAIITYKAVMLALTIAENAATIAQLALNAAMSLNPIGLIIAAVVALVAAIVILVKHFDEIATGFESIWKSVEEGAKNVYNTIVETFHRIVGFFSNLINSAKSWGHDLIQNFIDGIMERIQHFIDTIKNLAQTVRDFLGFSEPELGPLSNFHTFAPDMMELFAEGIRDNEHLITDQIAKSFDLAPQITNYGIDNMTASGFVSNSDTLEKSPTSALPIDRSSKPLNITLEIDKTQLARVIFDPLRYEQNRRGPRATQ